MQLDFIYHGLTGCKPPHQEFLLTRSVSVGSTASKGLIGSTNNQWGGVRKPPLIEVSLYSILVLEWILMGQKGKMVENSMKEND